MNIPTYRAKKIDSDEYVIGNYIKVHNKFYIYEDGTSDIYLDDEECFDDGSIDGEIRIIDLIFEIDSTTLAIHFPDMLDSQGNKIFASLNVKGGSLLEYKGTVYEVIYLNYLIQGVANMHSIKSELFEYTKLIGIQE